MTNDRDGRASATVNENAWKPGSAGGEISGQTLLRATGLVVPSKSRHSASVVTYCRLKSANPVSENGFGDLNSQAQNAVVGRPAFPKMSFIRRNPSPNGTGLIKRNRRMLKPGRAATPAEY